MSAVLTYVAKQMFNDLRTQLETTTVLQGDRLPALAKVVLPNKLNVDMQDVAAIIQTILDEFSAMDIWYLSYTCSLCAKNDTFKLTVQRTSIYGQ